MAPRDRAAAPAPHNLSGRVALQLGVVAVITALIPGIGDVLAAPVALASLVLGVVGYLRCEKGTATNPAQAIAGGVLGISAGCIILASYLIAASAP